MNLYDFFNIRVLSLNALDPTKDACNKNDFNHTFIQ